MHRFLLTFVLVLAFPGSGFAIDTDLEITDCDYLLLAYSDLSCGDRLCHIEEASSE
jgi:hypothetical protein